MPGQPVSRSRAVSGSFPPGNSLSRITGCHWPAAIIQQAQELSRFAAHTLIRAIQKRHPIVKKLWTMRLPCGIVRKTKN
jgi:hypothetical protein